MRTLFHFFLFASLLNRNSDAWSIVSRRTAMGGFVSASTALVLAPPSAQATKSGCTDIDSCREIGNQRDEKDLKENPVLRLKGGVSYKVLKPGVGSESVAPSDKVDVIFSINSGSAYMYSRGFGYEKVDVGGGNKVPDLGLDSYIVKLGTGKLPVGIEDALVGMKKGERRRIVLPPSVGFETSNWQPEPQTTGGKQSIISYKRLLAGNGSNNPPFLAPTIWDVEVLTMRK